jgi:hypothetical protein
MTLEFGRSDLEASDFHDLFEPIDDEVVAVLVDNDLVSRPDPPKSPQSVTGVRKGGRWHTH